MQELKSLSRERKDYIIVYNKRKVQFSEYGPAFHPDYQLIINHKLPKGETWYYGSIYKQDEQTKDKFKYNTEFFVKVIMCNKGGSETWVDTEFFNTLNECIEFVLNKVLSANYIHRDPRTTWNELYLAPIAKQEDETEIEEEFDYDSQPDEVKEILDRYRYTDNDYRVLAGIADELLEIGYEMDYGLDAETLSIKKIKPEDQTK